VAELLIRSIKLADHARFNLPSSSCSERRTHTCDHGGDDSRLIRRIHVWIKQAFAGVTLVCTIQTLLAGDKRPLTVEDAVSTRRIFTNTVNSEVELSPDGTQIAFIVKA